MNLDKRKNEKQINRKSPVPRALGILLSGRTVKELSLSKNNHRRVCHRKNMTKIIGRRSILTDISMSKL